MEIDAFDLDYEPGARVVYSDLGFLLLGKVIEVVTGERLAGAVQTRTAGWGMSDTGYNPSDPWRCAATEWREDLGRHQVGEVHDERAATLGGVAGHAGLFSTAEDLARYGARYLPDHATGWFRRSRELQTEGLNERRGLGWQLWQPACFAGQLASANGFGHTGFTGTSLWIDPDHDLVIVLLTNAVHFGRESQIQEIRRQVHTLIYRALAGESTP
jgi:CubicO group peptidase (beta-lactamase class C family)